MSVARISLGLAKCACCALFLVLASAAQTPVAVQAAELAQTDMIGQILDVADRMNLSPKQKEEVRPILNRSIHRRINVLREYGLQGDVAAVKYLTLRQKWSIIQQLHSINTETENQLSDYLYPSQMEIYREAEDKFRQEIERRIANRMRD
jgi:hypothetical protein